MPDTALPLSHDWTAEMWDWPLQQNDGTVKVTNTKEKFEVGLNVPCFTPKEIEVKVCGDELVIHCSHQPRKDNNGLFIKREINRAYKMPDDVDFTTLKSQLTNKGILLITASKKL